MSEQTIMWSDFVQQSFRPDLVSKLIPHCKKMINECGHDGDYDFGLTTYGQNKSELRDHTLWHSDFDYLKKHIEQETITYMKHTGYEWREDLGFRVNIRSMWVSHMFQGGHHEPHQHLGFKDHLSGTFYVNAPPGSGDLIFNRFDLTYDTWKQLPKIKGNYGPFNSLRYVWKAETGQNLLWKSSLIHKVKGNRNDNRIAISYNVEITNIHNNRDEWPSASMQDPSYNVNKNAN